MIFFSFISECEYDYFYFATIYIGIDCIIDIDIPIFVQAHYFPP